MVGGEVGAFLGGDTSRLDEEGDGMDMPGELFASGEVGGEVIAFLVTPLVLAGEP